MAKKKRFGLSMHKSSVSSADRDVIGLYGAEIKRAGLLSADEERVLFQQIKDERDEKKKKVLVDRAVSCNLRLVIKIANWYQGNGLAFEDLIQHGIMGLMHAVSKYDLSLGNRFSTYAVWWIRQGIIRGIQNECRSVRIPTSAQSDATEIKNIILDFFKEHGRGPRPEEIVSRSKKTLRAVRGILNTIELSRSLNEVVSDDEGDAISRLSLVACPRELSPSQYVEVADLISELKGKIAHLLGLLELPFVTVRDRDIFRAYHLRQKNHEGKYDETLMTIGVDSHITRERVRQICFRLWRELDVLESPIASKEALFDTFEKIELLQSVLGTYEDPRLTPPATFSSQEIRKFTEKIIIFRYPKKK